MEKFMAVACDGSGNPTDETQVTVKLAGTATLAVLYSDNGITAKANPFTNDSNGSFEFYTPTGRYDISYSKAGVTWDSADTTDIFIFDPQESDDWYAAMKTDFLTAFLSTNELIVDGGVHLTKGTAPIVLKTPTTTYKNGWLDILGDASNAPVISMTNTANAIALPFTITADPLIMDIRLERVTATASTIRVGLAGANLSGGDPANGFYLRQVDSNNTFMVVRSGSADSGVIDLGVNLTAMKRIRLVAISTSIRAYVDGVAKTAVTASIPTSQMFGFSAASSAVGSGVGVSLDYVRVWAKR